MTVYSPTWTTPAAPTTDGPLFAGYFYDAETALYQVRHRYYHAELGAFVSRDPVGYRDSFNLFEYVYGSPTQYVDPSGLGFWSDYWYYLRNPSKMDNYAQEVSDAAHNVIAGMGDSIGTTWGNINNIDTDFERSRVIHHLAYTNIDFAESVGYRVHWAAIHGESAALGAAQDLAYINLAAYEIVAGMATVPGSGCVPTRCVISESTEQALDADNIIAAARNLNKTKGPFDPADYIDDFALGVRPRAGQTIDATIDSTGKVHGILPDAKDLGRYDVAELARLRVELKQSVQKRIEVTVKMGADYGHNDRLAAEQQLIKSIEKHLECR